MATVCQHRAHYRSNMRSFLISSRLSPFSSLWWRRFVRTKTDWRWLLHYCFVKAHVSVSNDTIRTDAIFLTSTVIKVTLTYFIIRLCRLVIPSFHVISSFTEKFCAEKITNWYASNQYISEEWDHPQAILFGGLQKICCTRRLLDAILPGLLSFRLFFN